MSFDGKTFAADQVESFKLFPKFTCDPIAVPPPKPKVGQPT